MKPEQRWNGDAGEGGREEDEGIYYEQERGRSHICN